MGAAIPECAMQSSLSTSSACVSSLTADQRYLDAFEDQPAPLTETERYTAAIDAVNLDGVSIREAAERFKVNCESFRLRIRGRIAAAALSDCHSTRREILALSK
jgi:hypothetical protein